MDNSGHNHLKFSHVARWAARVTGHPLVFLLALGTIVVWGVTGPIFGFSDTWQLVINTGTTIVTFLMVFLIQNSQNRDTIAIHVKLDELVRAIRSARNTVLDLDELDEEELDRLLERYRKLGRVSHKRAEDAAERHPRHEKSVQVSDRDQAREESVETPAGS
ncbi:MAG: low affinity iron permease family protein [Planctomycetia bacterium]|nr:low affinity iron permease family protein [Planctomycetia bacterium]